MLGEPNKTDKTKETDKYSFDEFWSVYPKKVGKKECLKKWERIKDSDRQKISETLKAFVSHKPFDSYHHPNPLTYLNQERWNDELSQVKSTEQKYTPPKQIVIDHSSLN